MEYEIQQLIDKLKEHPNHWSYNWVISELEEILDNYKYTFPL